MRSIIFQVATISAILSNTSVYAENTDRESQVFSSLVEITVSGQDPNGVPFSSQGTGFVISKSGHILTVNHLLSSLPSTVAADSLKFSIRLGDKYSNQFVFDPSIIITRNALQDILLLKLPTPVPNRPALCFLPQSSVDKIVFNQTQVYTAGFPNALPFVVFPGLLNFAGPGDTIVTTIPIYAGQSGSPFYDARGQVFGMAKGSLPISDGAPLNVIIPEDAIRNAIGPYLHDCDQTLTDTDIDTDAEAASKGSRPPLIDASLVSNSHSQLCVYLGKVWGLTHHDPNSAPFGTEVLTQAVSGVRPNGLNGKVVKAVTPVNIRSSCPIERAGQLYFPPVVSVLKMGAEGTLSNIASVSNQSETYWWANISNIQNAAR